MEGQLGALLAPRALLIQRPLYSGPSQANWGGGMYAYLAFGDYYFNNAKGNRADLEKARAAYKKAAEVLPSSRVSEFRVIKAKIDECTLLLENKEAVAPSPQTPPQPLPSELAGDTQVAPTESKDR